MDVVDKYLREGAEFFSCIGCHDSSGGRDVKVLATPISYKNDGIVHPPRHHRQPQTYYEHTILCMKCGGAPSSTPRSTNLIDNIGNPASSYRSASIRRQT